MHRRQVCKCVRVRVCVPVTHDDPTIPLGPLSGNFAPRFKKGAIPYGELHQPKKRDPHSCFWVFNSWTILL